jgi:hypothetical protein
MSDDKKDDSSKGQTLPEKVVNVKGVSLEPDIWLDVDIEGFDYTFQTAKELSAMVMMASVQIYLSLAQKGGTERTIGQAVQISSTLTEQSLNHTTLSKFFREAQRVSKTEENVFDTARRREVEIFKMMAEEKEGIE